MVTFEVKVSLPFKTHQALQKLAALTGSDMGGVIAKLVDYWQEATPQSPAETSPLGMPSLVQLWRSPRGEMFPIGLELRAVYMGKKYSAKVTSKGIEFNDQTYDSPSAAAIAVKEAAGKRGAGANTNGWEFWEMWESKSKQWLSIQALKDDKK